MNSMQHYQARLFFAYLFLTITLELPVLFAIVRKVFKIQADEISAKTLFVCGGLCSFATYPYVWYVFPALIADQTVALIVAEIIVIFIEFILIKEILKISSFRSFIVSLVCNLFTIVLGSFMNRLIIDYKLFLF
ncbi:MAG: hypothetical protein ACQETH_16760 [Candidatus Rifleibacteriota bacterium]